MYGAALAAGAGAAVSGTFGILNNYLAGKREAAARAENFKYNEMAADNADARTRALYADLQSPAALLQQYKEAGLSPSLMFGGGGVGGQTAQGAQGAGATGVYPHAFGISAMEGAQIGLMMAQTKKTEAEARNIDPIANATVSSLLADAGYKKASEEAAAAQATSVQLDNYIKEHTKDASIYQICELAEKAGHDAERAYYEMKDAQLLNNFNAETLEDRKKIVHQQLESLTQSICESKSLQHLNEQQRKKVRDDILNAIDASNREWAKYNLSAQQFETFIEKQIPIIEKELEVKFQELGIEKRKLVINAITDSFKALAMGAMAASSMGIGKGSNATPANAKDVLTPKHGGGALNKNAPVYKTTNVWSY